MENILEFLCDVFGRSNSTLSTNIAKCVTSHNYKYLMVWTLNRHPLIKNYMGGLYNLRPPNPKLNFLREVNILLRYLGEQRDNKAQSWSSIIALVTASNYRNFIVDNNTLIDAITGWIKDISATNNNVDFFPGSCRAASTSKAKSISVDLEP